MYCVAFRSLSRVEDRLVVASHRIALHRAKVQVCGARGCGELAEGKRTILLQYEALERWNSQHCIIMSRIIAQSVEKVHTFVCGVVSVVGVQV